MHSQLLRRIVPQRKSTMRIAGFSTSDGEFFGIGTFRNLGKYETEHKSEPFRYAMGHGAGGRSSIGKITATVFGGAGFVGRYVVSELGNTGNRCYVPFRGCELEVRHLKPNFDLGQLGLMPFSPRDESSILDCMKNSDVVINLIGKNYETKHVVPTRRANGMISRVNYSFEDVNVNIPSTIARLAKQAGVKSMIHVSSVTANLNSASEWSRTKMMGEHAVRKEFPTAIIVRPSTIFGAEDKFLNWIAESSRFLPVFPLLHSGQRKVQPVFAEDVAKGIYKLSQEWYKYEGSTFELVGPHEYTMKEIIEFVSDVTTVRLPMVECFTPAAMAAAYLSELTIEPIMTRDGVLRLTEDAVPLPENSEGVLSFQDLGMTPSHMDKQAFDYLHRFRPGGHFRIVEGYH